LILIPLLGFSYQIFIESRDVYQQLTVNGEGRMLFPQALEDIEGQLQRLLPGEIPFVLDLEQAIREAAAWLANNIGPIFSQVFEGIFLSTIAFLAFYYLLKDGERLQQRILSVSPLAEAYNREILQKLRRAINSVIRGSLAIALLQGVMVGLAFWLLGIPNPTLWGAITIVIALIPTLGTFIVIIPGVLYLVQQGEMVSAVILAAWGLIAVAFIDDLLRPKLIERGLAVHPFLILLSALGGIHVFGIIGFLLGPLILSFLFTMYHIYQEEFNLANE
jgi:predicted PurR-regulated permease PerM